MKEKLTHLLGRAGRLKRNLTHNRAYIIYGWRIYVRAQNPAQYLNVPDAGLSAKTARIYVRPSRLVFRETLPLSSVAITVPHLGMFGNAMAALLPPVARAIAYGLGHVIVHGPTVLSTEEVFDSKGVHNFRSGLQLWLDAMPRLTQNRILCLVWDKSLTAETSRLIHQETWQEIRKVLLPGGIEECFGADTLVVHLRGGDAYGGSRFLLNHGQPPLAYYTKIIKSRSPARVIIVHQGTSMPTLQPLIEFCTERGIAVTTQSGSLRDDIFTLLGATALVAGRGSFIPQVVGLSPCVEDVYTYESGYGLALSREGVTTHRVIDVAGDYRTAVLSDNWRNTVAQRETMVRYPEDSLEFDEI
ncbi:hypothetical protein N9C74_02465 [Pontimonas sp.]|nr:hypothetical protein [Pontimonas sp.]